jgi:uncharacterized cupredoxin-like copper-binding protein
MRLKRLQAAAMLATAIAVGTPGLALAAGETVNVSLWDHGPESLGMLGQMPAGGMGMGMGHGKMGTAGMGPMGVSIDQAVVPAGEVTFEVTNASRDLVHEMVLSPVADLNTPLPYVTDMEQVDEDAAGHLGEVSELEPGQSGALRVTLEPGEYILYCNIPGHYAMGMWTLLEVKG